MSLHPIRALDQVLGEYRSYLRTEFRAKDEKLRAALERELDTPGFLAQEPFYQAHRPFKNGKPWRELPLDAKLTGVMERRSRCDAAYCHQSDAIETLLGADARPVVVTTGTGSGKTEAFLLPVIQNAFEDSVRFKKSGLTAILIYPMNALANDQALRINEYLTDAGMAGAVRVEQYDRSTSQEKRQEMRSNPPHILLTNYMMLEYLLVRPADRDDIFANHRCRFLVLDEVHTYRGILGSNLALLIRRLKVHLQRARQDWKPDVDDVDRPRRYPQLIPVGTSATIKSVEEEGRTREEVVQLRDEAVQEFFGTLTGTEKAAIRVLGEELQEVAVPAQATYPASPAPFDAVTSPLSDADVVRQALCRLAGLPTTATVADAARHCRLLWDLNRWLIRKPMSVSQIAEQVQRDVPARGKASKADVTREVQAALVVGAALPEGTPGALRLRAHRFVRGGWKFHRCVNPDCGKLYPMGEQRCGACQHPTAPLYLCRNCGADYLRLGGDPEAGPLQPLAEGAGDQEWMVYEPARFDQRAEIDDDELTGEDGADAPPPRARRGRASVPDQIRERPVLDGSLDPGSLQFSSKVQDYRWPVTLTPARTRCLCCGGTAGSRNVITPVALGTSAAVKVLGEGLVESLAEANRDREGHDGKERLLVFSDSRQDAAHQARFIIFASRYDRMRRLVYKLLKEHGALTLQRTVELLGALGINRRDNPLVDPVLKYIVGEPLERIRCWEEAPLLDEIAVTAGFRATLFNLGLAGVTYQHLTDYVQDQGHPLARSLGLALPELEYVCRVLLDDMRTRSALSRPMLRYHPLHTSRPSSFAVAEWERRVQQPQGYAAGPNGEVVPFIDAATIPTGIRANNLWRKPGGGGRGPSAERLLKNLLMRFGGIEPTADTACDVLAFLRAGNFVVAADLFGARDRCRLFQVNADLVELKLLDGASRHRCDVCGCVRADGIAGLPCAKCHGRLAGWSDAEVNSNRYVQRIRSPESIPLVAGEHTAQVTTADRAELENRFKARPEVSPVNVLACSPTLEMGIDVGGLDAVVMRNVPPRPDNYAQRGGRAGRRSRVGIVLGYARSTPHDQYFYDSPREMIAGEVPAPALSLGNRDVIKRHLYAIVFGAAEPGLAGRMVDYVDPQGNIKAEAVQELKDAVTAQFDHAVGVAQAAWGADVLIRADLAEKRLRELLAELPDKIQYVIEATSRQVIEMRQAMDRWYRDLEQRRAGFRAGDLVARLLGIPVQTREGQTDADDRSAGYPLRRFAEFGLLPGYEFPAEPAALRLLGDDHEEDPISVTRRFGIGQFQPEAHVYARRRRWKVAGLDTASPWNPRSDGPTWLYRVCAACGLRHTADHPSCPRCKAAGLGQPLPGYDLAGFIAKRDERPILDEEDRFAVRNLVQVYSQWNGPVVGRWSLPNGWKMRLSRNEEVRWVNEGMPPKPADFDGGLPVLHRDGKGWLLCPTCGRLLDPPPKAPAKGGKKNAAGAAGPKNSFGHADDCPQRGAQPRPLAIATSSSVEVLRLMVPVPKPNAPDEWKSWGLSLGYALAQGMQRHFALADSEIDFELEGPWASPFGEQAFHLLSLAFIDPSFGGSGYLPKIAEDLHLVARRAIEHLDHATCEDACYRCLKAYNNQRYHDLLRWPQAIAPLDELAQAAPTVEPLQRGDFDDPRPWLNAYAAGVGSPLELKFLRLFEQHGFQPQKQVPIAPEPGGLPISVADFAVPERRLAIYVDGVAFHVGQNLRRDRYIRDRLRQAQPPWRVEELRAADLAQGVALVDRLFK